ncbi:MAG: tetratricopeptide repeat protein [Candidatus Kryptoniota bacterium]
MRNFALIVIFSAAVIVEGCSSISRSLKSSNEDTTQVDMIAINPNYRVAMDHFVDGNLNDVNGEYAQAILDYQDALRYYSSAAILDAMAQDYIRLGKSDMAIQKSHEAVSLSSANINYKRTLAEAFLTAFEVDSAKTEYEKIVAMDSSQAEDILSLAQIYQQSNPEKAADFYEKVLRLNGPDLPTMMQLVQIYNSLNQFGKSIGVLDQMLKIDPSNVAIKEMLADLYLQTGDNEKALGILDNMLLVRKNDLNLKARAATAYLRLKNYDKADSLLDTIFNSDSSKADAKFAIAQFYLDEMQHDSSIAPFALQIFNKLLKLYPRDGRAFLLAGLGNSDIHDDSLAELYLNKSVAIDSTNSGAWQALAVFYFQKNDFNRMANEMSRAVGIFPEDFRINLFYGLALNRVGKNAEAVKPLEKAVALKPMDMDALSTLALVYEALSRYDDAYRVYETALKVDSNNSLILNNYAYSLSERELDLQKALKMAQMAVKLDPKNSAYLDTIGWVYFKLGDYENAESFVKKALLLRTQADGSPATLEEHLGDIYAKIGDMKNAVKYWEKALEHDQSNVSLKDKIAKAKT